MPRQLRIEYPGAIYHVMARGDRREAIFMSETDREYFLATLAEVCGKTGWRIHAWVLMSNHYHWVLETPKANLVEGMHWFQNTYTRRFNTRNALWGHVFGGRYKAVLVEPDTAQGDGYLSTLLDYVHLNPVRAGLVNPMKGLGLLNFRWSSLSQAYAVAPSQRGDWMETKFGFAAGQVPDTVSGRRRFVEQLERRATEEKNEKCGWHEKEGQTLNSTLSRGWYWGSQQFREQLLGLLKTRGALKQGSNRNYRTSKQSRDEQYREAGQILEAGRLALGLSEEDLESGWGSDPRKVAIATTLHLKTTVPQGLIAERLGMRSAANVSQQIRRFACKDLRTHSLEIRQWLKMVKSC